MLVENTHIVSTRISIWQLPTIHETVLRDKIVVTHAENKPFVIIANHTIDRHDSNTLPFLVQERCVLISSIVDTKAAQLRGQVEFDEWATSGRRDSRLQDFQR